MDFDLASGLFTGERISAVNSASLEDDEENELESHLKPLYNRKKLFTIDSQTSEIFCFECQMTHNDLPWRKTFDLHRKSFGLAHELIPDAERSSLISHNHQFDAEIQDFDIFFMKHCSNKLPVIYHPLSISNASIGDTHHPLERLNGLWVGTYGGHGLEILCLEFLSEFLCPGAIDGREKTSTTVNNVLVARKITGDRNVPHGQISFAAIYPISTDSTGPICYEGIGQSK